MNVRSWAKYRLLLPLLAAVLGVLGLLSPAVMGEAEGAGAGREQVIGVDLTLRIVRDGDWQTVGISMLVLDDGHGPSGPAATSARSEILEYFPGAYVVEEDGVEAQYYLWHFWPYATASWAYNSSGKPAYLSNDHAVVQAAANTWNNANGGFTFTGGGTTTRSSGGCFSTWDGFNTVGWGLFTSTSTLGAVCHQIVPGFTYAVAETDMILASDKAWTTSNTGISFDLQSVALHEFGHMLGLDHPIGFECDSSPSPVMCPTYERGTLVRTLRQDDIDGLRKLYIDIAPAPSATATPVFTATPTVSPAANFTPTPTWVLPPTFTPTVSAPPTLTPDPGGFARRVTLPLLAKDTGSGPVPTATPYLPPTATPYFPPTATPYFPPTATPTIPFGGGGLLCYGTRTTADWRIQVSPSFYSWELFEITVTPLTEEAVASTFRVRVYDPSYGSYDSSTKYPYFVGQSIRLYYGSDFYRYAPYPTGLYEVELRVGFLREASLYISC